MDIVQNINHLLYLQGLNKREFSLLLQDRLENESFVPNEQTIYGYLNGKRELKIKFLPAIADILGCTIDYLFTGKPTAEKYSSIEQNNDTNEISDLIHECLPISTQETLIAQLRFKKEKIQKDNENIKRLF